MVKDSFATEELVPPTEDEIEETLQQIQDMLELPEADLLKNFHAVKGYRAMVDVLADDVRSYSGIPASLAGEVARTMAVLAVDYLNGDCSKRNLLSIPLKQ